MDASGRIIIYLAGPIDGINPGDARGWREQVEDQVPTGVLLFSPAHAYMNVRPVNAQAIDWINKTVIRQCDGVLANLSGPGRGFGTIREIEFARLGGKPVAVVGDLDIHYSAWDCILAESFDQAIEALLKAINEQREQMANPLSFLMPGQGLVDPGDDD